MALKRGRHLAAFGRVIAAYFLGMVDAALFIPGITVYALMARAETVCNEAMQPKGNSATQHEPRWPAAFGVIKPRRGQQTN